MVTRKKANVARVDDLLDYIRVDHSVELNQLGEAIGVFRVDKLLVNGVIDPMIWQQVATAESASVTLTKNQSRFSNGT